MLHIRLIAKTLFFLIFPVVLFAVPARAESLILGSIRSVDTHGNVVIEIPEGPSPSVGDKITIQESAFGGIGVYLLGEWQVTEVSNRLVKGEVQSLTSNDLPKVNGSAHIYIADSIQPQAHPPYHVRLQNLCDRGDMKACTDLGLRYKWGYGVEKRKKTAFILLTKAANAGYARGQFELSWLYRFGDGVEASSSIADKLMLQAADQGLVQAQENLGYFALGIEKDYQKAEKWYRKAAAQGDSLSQHKLGVIFGYDRYTDTSFQKADYREAAKWYEMAAEQHLVEAQVELARMYNNGIGVPQNRNEAIRWYLAAAENGSDWAKSALKQLGVNVEDHMVKQPPEQIAALQGIRVEDLTAELRNSENIMDFIKGVRVTDVAAGAPFDEILLPGSIITRINYNAITNSQEFASIPPKVAAESESIIITAYYNGTEVKLEVASGASKAVKQGEGHSIETIPPVEEEDDDGFIEL